MLCFSRDPLAVPTWKVLRWETSALLHTWLQPSGEGAARGSSRCTHTSLRLGGKKNKEKKTGL